MKKFLFKICIIVLYIIAAWFLAMQLAYFLSFNYDYEALRSSRRFCLDPAILRWQGNDNYIKYAAIIIFAGLIPLLMWLIFPSKANQAERKAKRSLTSEEKMQYTHLASRREAKKGLARLQFNKYGNLNHIYFNQKNYLAAPQFWIGTGAVVFMMLCWLYLAGKGISALIRLFVPGYSSFFLRLPTIYVLIILAALNGIYAVMAMPLMDQQNYYLQGNSKNPAILIPHIRDYSDFVFDPAKKLWNRLMFYLKASDVRKMNELHYWRIADSLTDGASVPENEARITCRKSGLPILTSKRMVWVEPNDNHSLIIGTTNSGKTFSVIEGMIETTAMAGHSMFVNDLKGELYAHHVSTLKRLGYKVLLIDWIEPEKGECWNPFGLVVRKYREAEAKCKYSDSFVQAKKELLKINTELLYLYASHDQRNIPIISAEQKKSAALRLALEKDYENQPHPDFSEAYELLEDETRILCEEKNSKQPFFWQQAQALMSGIICFLLEYEYLDPITGEVCKLDDEQINFQNIKLMKTEGFNKYTFGAKKETLLKWYLDNASMKTSKAKEKLYGMAQIDNSAPNNSNNDIFKTFDNHIALGTMNEKIARMTCRTSFDFESIAKEKTAIFMIVHDEKTTFYPFVTLFVTQFYNEIVKTSRQYAEQKLPIPFDIIWDEFGISPALSNPETVFAASRFRGVRWNIVIQEYSQLDNTYGKDVAKAITGNIMNTVFLLANDPDTLKKISGMAGKKLAWSKEKGQYETVPVITEDELRHLSLSEAVILRQRKMPIKTRYYPYNRYVYYKNTRSGSAAISAKELPKYKIFSLLSATEATGEYGKQLIQADLKKEAAEAAEKEENEESQQL